MQLKEKPTITKRRTIAAALDGSLSETLERNKVSAALANQLALIYAYTIDFFKIQKGINLLLPFRKNILKMATI